MMGGWVVFSRAPVLLERHEGWVFFGWFAYCALRDGGLVSVDCGLLWMWDMLILAR